MASESLASLLLGAVERYSASCMIDKWVLGIVAIGLEKRVTTKGWIGHYKMGDFFNHSSRAISKANLRIGLCILTH